MTARFRDSLLKWLFKWEGTTYENDKDDPGGATRYGIDQRSHPNEDIKNMTAERASEIYWNEYYVKYHCDKGGQPLDWVIFNACVNCGWGRASKLLIESKGSPVRFIQAQAAFYRRLVALKPVAKKYLKGWINRLNDIAKVIKLEVTV